MGLYDIIWLYYGLFNGLWLAGMIWHDVCSLDHSRLPAYVWKKYMDVNEVIRETDCPWVKYILSHSEILVMKIGHMFRSLPFLGVESITNIFWWLPYPYLHCCWLNTHFISVAWYPNNPLP
jgi:hypothetical protein